MGRALVIHKGHYFGGAKARKLLKALKSLEIESTVISDNPQWTKEFADHVIITPNWNNFETLKDIIAPFKKEIIYVGTGNDWGVPTVGRLNDYLGLPGYGYEAAHEAIDKIAMLKRCREEGIDTYNFAVPMSERDLRNLHFKGPVFVKPSHSTGSVSDKEWGYRVFDGAKDFYHFLVANDFLDEFLAIQNSTDYQHGRFFVADFLDNSNMPDLYFNIANSTVQRWFSTKAEVGPNPYDFKPVKTWGPIEFSEAIEAKINPALEVFSKIGFNNTFANLQFIWLDNQLFPLDLNGRISNIWTHIQHLICPNFFEDSLRSFMGEKVEFRLSHEAFLRKPYQLKPGRIKSIKFPDFDSSRIETVFIDKLQPGMEIPPQMNSVGTHPQIFCVGTSFDSCEKEIDSIIDNTEVIYE